MSEQLPQVIHTYQNHTLDSTRWQHYRPRPDDIVVTTAYKAGTTWMQELVRQLILMNQAAPPTEQIELGAVSYWLESRFAPIAEVVAQLEAQQHRRFIKTHLALDGLPFYPQVKYIVVGRDARDVAMSMWNHHANYTAGALAFMQNFPDRVGDALPPATNFHEFWRDWIQRGWFAWESEGYPYWGNMHHTQTWWAYRHLPNIHFVHYHDLKSNLVSELHRLADFLGLPLPTAALPDILCNTTLDAMRARAERLNPGMIDFWQEGAKTFFYKGTNGRWQDVLSAEELALYEEKAARVLAPDCQAWLEQGRVAFT